MAIEVDTKEIEALSRKLLAEGDKIVEALEATAQEIATEFLARGTQELAGAGLTSGAKGAWTVSAKRKGFIATIIGHLSGIWNVFEKGATVSGKPLMWIPLDKGAGPPSGKFFLVERAGKPLLGSVETHQIEYVGVETVKIPKTLDLKAVAQEVAADFESVFLSHYKDSGNW